MAWLALNGHVSEEVMTPYKFSVQREAIQWTPYKSAKRKLTLQLPNELWNGFVRLPRSQL